MPFLRSEGSIWGSTFQWEDLDWPGVLSQSVPVAVIFYLEWVKVLYAPTWVLSFITFVLLFNLPLKIVPSWLG